MARKTKQAKQPHNQYTDEYRAEALKLAERIGVSAAARELGLHGSQIYGWRGKTRQDETESESHKRLLEETAKPKRQLADQQEEMAILKKASAYFARNQK
ncbi:MAG: transposase [Burkholderiaceae bacterium]